MRYSLLLLIVAAPAWAAEKTGFVERTHKGGDGVEAKYQVFLPHNYTTQKKWPTILFLHGSGETGTDGKKQTTVGLGKTIRERASSFPFVVVFPQAQKREPLLLQTWYPGHPEGDRAMAIFTAAQKEFSTDAKRLYLTGNSMGGYGAWALAEKFPDRWAAVAPVCGGGDPAWAPTLKNVPIWCFHGQADATVPVTASQTMIEGLKRAGASPKYDEYPGVGHNSWDKAYATDALYDWFLKHTTK